MVDERNALWNGVKFVGCSGLGIAQTLDNNMKNYSPLLLSIWQK